MRQNMPYEDHLGIVVDFGYQPEVVPRDVEDRIDLLFLRQEPRRRASRFVEPLPGFSISQISRFLQPLILFLQFAQPLRLSHIHAAILRFQA